VSLASTPGALHLTIQKHGVSVKVLVPDSVLEWFADAEPLEGGSKVSDWCDYEGYDNTPVAELEHDMAEDIASFVNQLIERDLRYAVDSKRPTKAVLEWSVDGQWKQALPFVVPAA
jgi:hypothetical protein